MLKFINEQLLVIDYIRIHYSKTKKAAMNNLKSSIQNQPSQASLQLAGDYGLRWWVCGGSICLVGNIQKKQKKKKGGLCLSWTWLAGGAWLDWASYLIGYLDMGRTRLGILSLPSMRACVLLSKLKKL